MGTESFWNRRRVEAKHHRYTRVLYFIAGDLKRKKKEEGESMKEKGARTLVVPEP